MDVILQYKYQWQMQMTTSWDVVGPRDLNVSPFVLLYHLRHWMRYTSYKWWWNNLLFYMNILKLICVAGWSYALGLNAFLLNRRHVRSFFHPLTLWMECMPWPLLSRISHVRIFLSVVLLIHLMTQWHQSISRWIV